MTIAHLGTSRLKLGDERNVVALVLSVDVALLEHEADHRGAVLDARSRGVLLLETRNKNTRSTKINANIKYTSASLPKRTQSAPEVDLL